MERMTIKNADWATNDVTLIKCGNCIRGLGVDNPPCADCEHENAALEKLAAYEDTCRTPGEVADLEKQAEQYQHTAECLQVMYDAVKAERDEAVKDLRDNADRPCYVCKNWVNGRCVRTPKDCAGFWGWQWRGLEANNEP